MTPLKTAFGKRHGWEVQRYEFDRQYFNRLTGKTWSREASAFELILWRLLKKLDPEQFKVVSRGK